MRAIFTRDKALVEEVKLGHLPGKGLLDIGAALKFSGEMKLVRPLDVVLFLSLITAAIWSTFRLSPGKGNRAVIYVRNQRTAKLSLSGEVKTIRVPTEIGDIVIHYGSVGVKVVSSPCRLKICKHRGNINRSGHRIICVPGRMTIIVRRNALPGEDQVDGFSY